MAVLQDAILGGAGMRWVRAYYEVFDPFRFYAYCAIGAVLVLASMVISGEGQSVIWCAVASWTVGVVLDVTWFGCKLWKAWDERNG